MAYLFEKLRQIRSGYLKGKSNLTAIEFKNASFSYKGEDGAKRNKAIDGLSLKIEQGDFVALVGHNGSGKSTAARLMNALLLPDEGDVEVFGVNTKDKDRLFDVRSNVGMVFQNPDNQMIATIVEDDIAFGPENLGIEREEIGRRIDFALKAVGMEEYRKATPFKLSGGQKQRIAIAGVLAIKPKVLVLDESTAMLDPRGRREIFDVIKSLNEKEGMTVILITHYMDEAALSNKVVVMSDGKLITEGSPRDVYKNAELIESVGLKLPRPTKLALHLKENGLDLGEILTTKELLDALCR